MVCRTGARQGAPVQISMLTILLLEKPRCAGTRGGAGWC